jgi:4-hydroxybenzoate polyprenyltransferase
MGGGGGGGMGGRLRVYLSEMFPLAVHVPASIAGFYAVFLVLQAMMAAGPVQVTLASAAGAVSLVLTSLTLRIFDELKDLEVDRVLFPTRPVPSGRVKVTDLYALLAVAIAALILLNVFQARPVVIAFAIFLGFSFLTFRYFFVPGLIRHRPLWLLVTHQPLVPLAGWYATAHAAVAAGLPGASAGAPTLAAIGLFWLPTLSWEIARKVRAPEDEDAYVTYSRIFGPRAAAAIALAGMVGAAAGLGMWVAGRAGLGWAFRAPLAAAAAIALVGILPFIVRPVRERAKLRRVAEMFVVILYAAAVAGVIAARGVTFS